jgi:hypothetical protein
MAKVRDTIAAMAKSMRNMRDAGCGIVAAMVVMIAGMSAGCIQRTITINSEPQGALVHLNDEEVGRTPLTVPFTFYGTYDVRLEKEGYETLNTQTQAQAPWWETPGPDLFAEAIPGNNEVNLKWDFVLTPQQPVSSESLIDRAKQLRATFKPQASDVDQAAPAPASTPAPVAPAPAAPAPAPAPAPATP